MNLTVQKFSCPHKTRKIVLTALIVVAVPLTLVALWLAYFINTSPAQAAVGINKQITYQGKIVDSGGSALSTGSYGFKFIIYSAETGGSNLWEETWTSATSAGAVSVNGGSFSVALGTSTSLSTVDFNSDSLWLEVNLDADGNGSFEEVFTPRRKLGSAPYAFNADKVDGINAATTATASSLLALDASAGMNLNSVTTTDTVYIGGALAVVGTPTFTSDLIVSGTATSTFAGNISTVGNVYINGSASTTDIRIGKSAYFDEEYNEGAKSAAFTVNWNNGNKQKITITGVTLAATFTAPAGPTNLILKVVQGDGNDTITWPGTVKWPAGTAPTLSTGAGAIDFISCYYDGTNYYCQSALTFS